MRPRLPATLQRHRYFNPRTPYGVRQSESDSNRKTSLFQSTHPIRGATVLLDDLFFGNVQFQSTHPIRGATVADPGFGQPIVISIHAPHTGCDLIQDPLPTVFRLFQSTHPIRGATPIWAMMSTMNIFQSTHPIRGATSKVAFIPDKFKLFQSTHPIRGATSLWLYPLKPLSDFNPRTPYGVRRHSVSLPRQAVDISIHAPHTGCDHRRSETNQYLRISIHAPHTGCDTKTRSSHLR